MKSHLALPSTQHQHDVLPSTQHHHYSALLFFFLICLFLPSLHAADFPGGFIEHPDTAEARAVLSKQQIKDLLPERGSFTFPAPYNTQAVRLTNADDCDGNNCVKDVGYSYWRNINNHVGHESMLIVLGLDINKGGSGPTLFEYNKSSEELRNLGPLFPSSSSFAWASAEGWYFSATRPTSLYITSGSEILRHDVISGETETVFDIRSDHGNGYYLWQTHSSDDDRVHSATVRRSSDYDMLGCVVYREDIQQSYYYPKEGEYDECQIDRSGKWLVIKEDVDQRDGEDNRIINVETGAERVLLDRDGAGGHSDLGHGYMIASDNWASLANTVKLWRFDEESLNGTVVYTNNDWGASAPSHISHTNANSYTPVQEQIACGSSANRWNAPHANEIICLSLDGSQETLVVAPVMTDLDAEGDLDDYNKSPKGNLDVTGQYFIWTSNTGGSRLDAFLVKVPTQLLTGTAATNPPATDTKSVEEEQDTSTPVAEEPDTSTTVQDSSDSSAPQMRLMEVGSVTSGSVELTWSTDEPAENLVMYGMSFPNEDATPHVTQLSTSHSVTLSDLQPDTTYYYNAYVRDAAGNIGAMIGVFSTAVSSVSVEPTPVEPTPVVQPTSVEEAVSWTQRINVANDGDVLYKVSGCDGCSDAGAVSTQQIESGNGYLEFTATDENLLRFVGLTSYSSVTSGSNLDFSIRLQGRIAEIRENGSYLHDFYIDSGDVLRIEVNNGVVSYSRNGEIHYTSEKNAASTLRAGAAFYSFGSSVTHPVINAR